MARGFGFDSNNLSANPARSAFYLSRYHENLWYVMHVTSGNKFSDVC